MMREIKFYSVNDEYGEFSNFAPYGFNLKHKRWNSVEHYFQAQKFKGTGLESKIRKANNPNFAARLGRNRKYKIRRDWESVKVNVMREAVLAKFQQNPDICDLLINTGDAKLIEHTGNDNFWGDGGDGKGRNMLGRILMQVREELNLEKEEKHSGLKV